MWRSKKLIIAVVLGAVILAGSIGGAVLATDNGDDSQPKTLFDRVVTILKGEGVDITSEQLKDAFVQAQGQMRTEAMGNRLQELVNEGRITQGEADEYLTWQEARPDVPIGPGFGGRGGFRGMGGMRGFGGLCAHVE